MKKNEIINKATQAFGKAGLQFKKYSPEILVVVGIVGVVSSAVMACKATLKVNEVIEESKDNLDKIHECAETKSIEVYSEKDKKKDLAIAYAQTGARFAKLYGPSIVLGVSSIVSILASNDILRKRNAAMAAAYAVVDKGFKEYRSRVIERFGEEVDRELKYNIKAKEIDKIEVNEDGEAITKREKGTVVEANIDNGYAKWFDESSEYFRHNAEYNRMFLSNQQRYANDLLKSKGYLFLNDVYKMLGIPKTRAGQVVGWVYDENDDNCDNYVDFGIFEAFRDCNKDFVNGYEPRVLLDFNVDGTILDRIKEY